MLKGAAKVIDQAIGGHLSVNAIVVGMTCLFMLYSFIGGLLATAWTEFVQGFLILILSFMLVPLGWNLVGGLDGMKATLGASQFTLTAPAGIGIGFVIVLTLNGLIGIIAQPHLIAAVGTGRDEISCRVGHLGGNLVKRVCTVGWAIVGLMVAAMIVRGVGGVTSLADPEDAFGFACRRLLFPGGIGLLVACFLAANMASCSAFMVDSGALVTNGLYRRYVKPAAPDAHYLWVGRISGVLVTLVAVFYALFLIKRVLYSFLLTETMSTYFGISVLAGLVWRRANRWGAVTSLVTAIAANFLACWHLGERLDHWTPGVFLFSLGVGIVALIVVSLLTPPEPAAALDQFHANLQTPTDLPPGAAPEDPAALAKAGRQLLLVNLLHPRRAAHGFGFFRAYRTDLTGFLIGWAVVIGLVAGLWLAVRG
jgi:Na+/proline symporter